VRELQTSIEVESEPERVWVQRERCEWILVPLVSKGLAATELGFEQMNLAPKTRAEGEA
jgi:hypothetical protein